MTFKCAADSKPAVIVQPTNSSPEKKIAITNSPITLRYMGVGTDQKLISPKGLGYSFTSGPVFWVTNHTTNTLVLDLALESKSGTNWIIDAQPGSTYPVHHLLAFKKKEKNFSGLRMCSGFRLMKRLTQLRCFGPSQPTRGGSLLRFRNNSMAFQKRLRQLKCIPTCCCDES